MSVTRSHEHGLGLIEVLISLVVLSLGLLGAMLMWGQAYQAEVQNQWRSDALARAQELSQSMLSNPNAFAQGLGYVAPDAYDNALASGSTVCATQSCSPYARAQHDVLHWRHELALRLPGGRGSVYAAGNPNRRRIVVMWQDPSYEGGDDCQPPAPTGIRCLSLDVSP